MAQQGPVVACERGHRLVRFDLVVCDAGHEHRIYVCPMRRGSSTCGKTVVRPMYTSNCWERGGAPDRDD